MAVQTFLENPDFKFTAKQEKARDLMISDAVHICLGGGSRCVAGDTVIDGQTKTIAELADIGEPIDVVTTSGVMRVEAPFRKGSCELLEVVTKSGKRIEVTPDHMFWDGYEWVSADSITIDSRIAALPNRLPAQINHHELIDDTPVLGEYELENIVSITPTGLKDFYTIHVPVVEQYFANGILHHNSGKTLIIVRQIIVRALKSPHSRHAIFRFRFNSIKGAIVYDTFPKVMEMCWPGLYNKKALNKSDWFYTLPNGSEIWFGGLDDKERSDKILGNEYATIYLNETSQIPWSSRNIALSRLAQNAEGIKIKMFYDLNPTHKTHWVYRLFVDKIDPITKQPLARESNFCYLQINPLDNLENLPPEYLLELDDMSARERRRFRDGEFGSADEGALWYPELLDQNRRLGQVNSPLPDWMRVVVAVDPSGSRGEEDKRSDEIGIVVVALGTDNHGYLLEDLSGRYSPEEWGNIAVEAFRRHMADKIVGEVNFGGDMVRFVIHAVDSTIPFSEVHASRGKVVRAEPISLLYERDLIHHVGHFPLLEDQLCSMTQSGYAGTTSPDRADAAIWGFTEMFPGLTKKAEDDKPRPKVIDHSRAARYRNRSSRQSRSY